MDLNNGEPRSDLLEYYLPILLPEDREAVKRILEHELKEIAKLYRFQNEPVWIETSAQEEDPAEMGWKVYAEEIR